MAAPHDWRSLYPFHSHWLMLGDLRYHYVDEGSGDPLLMVHGNPTWSFYFRHMIEAFRSEFRTVAVDHIGCGMSDKPQQYAYTLDQHIDNLTALIERQNLQRITLVVHDWGGAIGLGAALRMPERFSRLVLLNTGAFPPPYVPLRIRLCRLPGLGAYAIRQWNLFARAALVMATHYPRRLAPAVRAGLLAPYDSWQHRVAIWRFVQDIPLTKRHPTWKTLDQIERQLHTLHHLPVLIVWGMRDWCFRPSCVRRFQQHFPDAEVHPLADAGHYVLEDAHQQVVSLVQTFLERRCESSQSS